MARKGTPGPKPMLENKELLAKIRECITSGKTLKDTANICGIELNTLYRWSCDNYSNISDKIEGWQRDYKLKKADENLDKILELDPTDKNFLKTIATVSMFVKETLDNKNYSKRSEVSGDITIVDLLKKKYDNSRESDSELEEKS